jgi:hypothetical protein
MYNSSRSLLLPIQTFWSNGCFTTCSIVCRHLLRQLDMPGIFQRQQLRGGIRAFTGRFFGRLTPANDIKFDDRCGRGLASRSR